MKFACCLVVAFVVTSSLSAAAATVLVPQIRVPDGFVVETVAQPPLVERPMMAAFDDRGRLFVTESAGLNLDYEKLKADPPNSVRMLEDVDGDGVFDRSKVFADRLIFPGGVVCVGSAVYVTDPPGVWKLEDLDDDGVCERRTQLVVGFKSIGNGADVHGPWLGPDGWLYFSDGRNGHRVTLGDGTLWEGKAAAVYRCRTDGSGLELVFGGGFDNPVEGVFTPAGELLVGVNLVAARPQRQDAIVFGIEGGVYPHDPAMNEFPHTGEPLPPVGDLGWVAVSGLTRFDGDAFGRDFDGNLFSALFNPHRVDRHVVARHGAGFRISDEPFLTSGDTDFHPTDVLQDPRDGSLLVVDTGGWFRIGCPASETAKPAVLGGIYRVRRKGAPRDRIETTQIATSLDRRIAALRATGMARPRRARSELIKSLASTQPAEAREAATTLGRIGDKQATAPLLDSLKRAADRFHEHAIVYALIRIGERDGTAVGLKDANAAVRRGALIALDQMRDGKLSSDEVIPLLADPAPLVRDEAMRVATRHPDWAPGVARSLRGVLADGRGVAGMVSAFAEDAGVQAAVSEALMDAATPAAAKVTLLEAVAVAPMAKMPAPWRDAVVASLSSSDEQVARQAVETVRTRGLGRGEADLLHLARDPTRGGDLRIAAYAAAGDGFHPRDDDFAFLLAQLDAKQPPMTRLAAARAFGSIAPSDEQLVLLATTVLPAAGPLEAQPLFAACEKTESPRVRKALDDARAKSKALRPAESISPEQRQMKLEELEPLLGGGDASRGQGVFFGDGATCSTCHAVAGRGGDVGPDLTKIGASRSGRDLLESVIFPSSTIARGFESFVAETTDGHAYAGTLAGETADAIRLKTPAEVVVPRARIKTFRPDRVSIMPQGLDAQLTKQELADLLAFLRACK